MGPLVILRSLPYTYLLGRRILSLTSSMSTIGCIDPATENRRLPSGASSAPATRAGTGCEGAVILATTGGPTARLCPRKPACPGVSMTNLLMRKRKPGRRFSSSPTVRRILGCLDAWSAASRISRAGIAAT